MQSNTMACRENAIFVMPLLLGKYIDQTITFEASVVVLEYSLLKGLILFIPVYNIVLSVHTLDVQFLILPFIALKSLTVNSCKKKNLPVLHDGNT